MFMYRSMKGLVRAALSCALVLFAFEAAAADENATLLRVFLRDGSTLVSYGEPARAGDRVVFSMPTGPLPNPPLHLVNLPVEQVDWDKTERYAIAARADQYLKGQAEIDYATLSGQLAQTLNDVTATTDLAQRLNIVEQTRKALAAWPAAHFNYKAPEVRQMVSMLDEAIADLRAAAGVGRFSLSLETHTDTAPDLEPLMPAPTLQESIGQVLNAARLVDNAAERTSLLGTALAGLDAGKSSLPAEWAATTRADVEARIAQELRIDSEYRLMSAGMLALADQRARRADVRGIQRLLARVTLRDRELGGSRPDAVNSLLGAIEFKLEAARRLRLARDRYELRLPVLAEYGAAIKSPMSLFAQLRPALEAIKALSGSSPAALNGLEQSTGQISGALWAIVPPEELASGHALLESAVQMAATATATRKQAALTNNMDLAWNASSAAAGALMLFTRARTDILAQLKPPQLR